MFTGHVYVAIFYSVGNIGEEKTMVYCINLPGLWMYEISFSYGIYSL